MENTTQKQKRIDIRKITVTAVLAAAATVLMMLNFNVPLMPGFIKMDLSELPALLASFALGPVSGAVVCLIKNLINLTMSTTGGVGELSNFLLGVFFVVPAGLIYQRKREKKAALLGAVLGAVIMAVLSVFSNYFVVYPVYTAFMPMEGILEMYRVINPAVRDLWDALIWFNMPFTFIKAMLSVVISAMIYKPLSPLLKGKK